MGQCFLSFAFDAFLVAFPKLVKLPPQVVNNLPLKKILGCLCGPFLTRLPAYPFFMPILEDYLKMSRKNLMIS